GKIRCMGDQARAAFTANTRFYSAAPRATQSFTTLDTFNTSFAEPVRLYEAGTDQFLGMISNGIYLCSFDQVNGPPYANANNPSLTTDIDLNSLIVMGLLSQATTLNGMIFFALPVEEVKIAP